METGWVIDFLWGAGKLLVHPLFYYSFFLAMVIGYRRVKRERKDFKIRIESGFYEVKNVLPLGLLIGIILSFATILAGVVIPFGAIILMGAVTILLSCTLQFRLLSPAYVIGITLFLLFFLYDRNISIPYLGEAIAEMESPLFPGLAVVMGALIIAEGLLIQRNAAKKTSPKLITSNRGLTVGAHESERIWLVPLFLFVPGGELVAPFEWWPVISLGEQIGVAPIFVPFVIGFSQLVQAALPKEAIEVSGAKVIGLGIFISAIAIGSIWMPVLSIVAAALAILGRELLAYSNRMAEMRGSFYFTNKDHGVFILGIIPDSPADKMGLQVGEVITKVNGQLVQSESELYEALQSNRAHCKLEVLNTNGEVRFVQKVVYEDDHYELGIIFVQDKGKVSLVS